MDETKGILGIQLGNTKPTERYMLKEELRQAEAMLKDYEQNCVPEKFGLADDELKFFLQNLFSKGLLRDDGVGAIGTGPNEIMSITILGVKFLEFIKL